MKLLIGEYVTIETVGFDKHIHLVGKTARIVSIDIDNKPLRVAVLKDDGTEDIISAIGMTLKLIEEHETIITIILRVVWKGIKSLFKRR